MSKLKKKRKGDYCRSYKKIRKEVRDASDPLYEMIVYALFLYGGGQGEAGEDVRRGAEFLQRNSGMTCIV